MNDTNKNPLSSPAVPNQPSPVAGVSPFASTQQPTSTPEPSLSPTQPSVPASTSSLNTTAFVNPSVTPDASAPKQSTPFSEVQQTPANTDQSDGNLTTQIPSLGTMPTSFETPQPENDMVPPLPQGPSNAIITDSKQPVGKFKILVIILVIIALIVYGVVGYLYFNNAKLKEEAVTVPTPAKVVVQEPKITPSIVPTIVPVTTVIKILNGNVVKEMAGQTTILIDKDDYKDTGIAGFSEVSVSPSEEYFCFASAPPALNPKLYFSTIDGQIVTIVSAKGRDCVWSNASDRITYTKDSVISVPSDIFVYSLTTKEETNLTNAVTENGVYRRYEITGWSDDNSMVNCTYEQLNPNDTANEVLGNCQIDVATSVVADL